jgi:mono/diheme cytochrome c family protein
VTDGAISGIRGNEVAVLDKLIGRTGEATPAREAALTMLSATVVRGESEPAVHDVFARAADNARPEWQRSALMRGAEVALLGAPMPGTRVRRAAARGVAVAAPCPTCPGGRAGPGGAYAFPRPRTGTGAQAPYGGANGGEPASFDASRGGPAVRLTREPASLRQLAAGSGELASRAAGVLARLEWPGKAGGGPAVAALTAEERDSFLKGQEVYRNICQACHQPNGRGQDRVAPSLVGSALALAPAGLPIRILLNGTEGSIGLMPSIGSVLTDEQIAGVLTYVRREWGQTGSPVDAATVKAVRAATAGRTRPWTNDELLALPPEAK